MATRIALGNLSADVVFKDIRNVHLSVLPPAGRVRISAPERMKLDTVRVFALSKLSWIKRQREKLQAQERETSREYLDRESHYVWGRRYLLKLLEAEGPPAVVLKHRTMVVSVRPGSDIAVKEAVVSRWYRDQVKARVSELVAKWSQVLGVEVRCIFVQRMKTKWGSCNPRLGSIRLNSELAKKPPRCLEYIVVHEMVHLLEPTHNSRFRVLMNGVMPRWEFQRAELNRLPVRHEDWSY